VIEQIVIVGLGCIGQAVLPLLERTWPRPAIAVVDRMLDGGRWKLAARHKLDAIESTITVDKTPGFMQQRPL